MVMLLTFTWWGCSATEEKQQVVYQSGDYIYDVLENRTIEILKYSGNASQLVIPDILNGQTVTIIGPQAFSNSSSLTSLVIPDSVTSIEFLAFFGCDVLASVTIGIAVEHVGGNPFANCSSLTEIVVSPDHPYLATIDGVLFHKLDKRLVCYPCTLPECTYTIPHGIQSVGGRAFYGCESLTSLTISNSVKNIEDGAFQNCTRLTSLKIPDSVTKIEGDAFYGCNGLMSVTIGIAVNEIDYNPFGNCESLTNIIISPDHPNLFIIDGVLYHKLDRRLVCYPMALSEKSFVIPNGIKSIGNGAFYNCRNLTSLTIPDSVTNIGNWSFSYCSSLTNLTVPNSVMSIGYFAFSECTFLNNLMIPNCVTSIRGHTFSGCIRLSNLTIPDSVMSIEGSAFYNCKNLTSLTIPDSVRNIEDYAFSGCEKLTLTVGHDSYAKEYAAKNGILYTYTDANEWLTTNLFTPDSRASGEDSMARYTGFYTGLENTARYVTFPYDDALLFEEPVGVYSPRLAYASMALSAASYSSENATTLMSEMGFVRCTPWDYRPSSAKENDFTGACMGYKQIVRDGKTWDLFLIAIQGTNGTYDWLSNFHFGDGNGVHAGFSQAKDTLMGHFRDYLKSLQTEGFLLPGGNAARVDGGRGNNLIWITGHSRGGAVGNLLAAELEGSAYVNGGNLHCYTFASPCVTSKPEAGNRQGFFNFINPGDFVTTVPLAQWGFARYGKTICLSDDPSWKTEMQDGFTRRTGWEYQGTSETENTKLIGEVLELAPTVDDYYHKNYGFTLSRNILSRLTKALGVPFTPQITCVANLFEGVAFAMAEDWLPAAGWGAVQAVQDNAYVNLLLRLFNSSKIEQGIPHAHSLESYLSWMAALASDAKAPSNPGLPAYISRLKVTGGTLSLTYEPGITEYTISVPAGSGKVSVSAEPASWYDLDAQASGKGKVALEFKSNKLGLRESGKTKVDLTIPNDGADLSLNVLTWETAEQTKYVLHFVR